jgi:IMP cyclohydrolase
MADGDVIKKEDVFGTFNIAVGTLDLPETYATGGIAVGTAIFGLASVDFVAFEVQDQDADEAVVLRYDRATNKVLAYQCINAVDALQEVANASAILAGKLARFLAIGKK